MSEYHQNQVENILLCICDTKIIVINLSFLQGRESYHCFYRVLLIFAVHTGTAENENYHSSRVD